jgi:hypothetical protein
MSAGPDPGPLGERVVDVLSVNFQRERSYSKTMTRLGSGMLDRPKPAEQTLTAEVVAAARS